MKKQIVFLIALFLQLCSGVIYAENIIRINAPIEKAAWVWSPAPALVSVWVNLGGVTGCTNWSPEANTIYIGQTFTQTATDCQQSQQQTSQAREQNSVSLAYQNIGDPTTRTQVIVATSTQQAVGAKPLGSGFSIKNAVEGKNGIYTITNGSQTFSAYVDMTTNGGHWVLIGRWAGVIPTTTTFTFNDLVVKNNSLKTYSNDTTNYPVVPTGAVNTSNTAMLVDVNTEWQSMYGQWLQFATFPAGNIQNTSGFQAQGGDGKAHTVYHQRIGWFASYDMTADFGIWNVPNNSGHCGGANIGGSTKPCPIMSNNSGYTVHGDFITTKLLYLKTQ